MSLKARKFICGMGVGFLLLGAFIIGEGLGKPTDIEAYMGRGGPFSACGIEFSQGRDSFSNGTYSFNYYVARSGGTPLNTAINFQTKTFKCFCPSGLNAQGLCLSCDSGTVESRVLPSGQSSINIPISMHKDSPYCGGYQMDAAFVSVNGDTNCNTLMPDGSFNGGIWGKYDATGQNCGGITPTPTTPVLTPTPTTPVTTPTPTTPVLTPTPTTPVLTPTPTTPVLSGTPTPTPTTPVTTGTPTPTPTRPADSTPTPTPDNRCVDTAPSSVRNLKINRLSSTSVKLTWDKPETGAVTDNAIKYRLVNKDFEYGVTSTGNVTEYSIGSLQSNTDYCFSVYPKNNCAPGSAVEVCTGKGQVLGATTLPATSSLPLSVDVILATLYTLISAGLMTKGWLWVKSG